MNKIFLLIPLLLLGCSQSTQKRYSLLDDETPTRVPILNHIENAFPRYEPYSLQGNKDYEVMGQNYEVLIDPEAFHEKGLASWYGKKFHGYRTSNGEIYDMYSMTAAHKTLPLPSYVEVKNTLNGRVITVRVNDRGPFHEGRIIDLSYAAAAKLDILKTGIGSVEIKLIKVAKPLNDKEWKHRQKHNYYVQLEATSSKENAIKKAAEYTATLSLPTSISHKEDLYRIRLGPFFDSEKTRAAKKIAKENHIYGAFIVTESVNNELNNQ